MEFMAKFLASCDNNTVLQNFTWADFIAYFAKTAKLSSLELADMLHLYIMKVFLYDKMSLGRLFVPVGAPELGTEFSVFD